MGQVTLKIRNEKTGWIVEREMSIRIPAAHHKKLSQGWLVGYWSV